jgi:hypothetical protein
MQYYSDEAHSGSLIRVATSHALIEEIRRIIMYQKLIIVLIMIVRDVWLGM